ncbi:hypothetical protein GCM10010967_03100 [Dyadobacter beijingensis]|uniref:DUF4411 family protein n=1 Tax=Dyadobacter beijingensis TaxID=365489 RepID=A0ABQ2HBU0_9BACT|nr:DUF4411 family protein [Dyadobacter beijingensis]GGM74980.1 hypothetical protein GCM10010967_03100 [Dyadobacter beijingensis]
MGIYIVDSNFFIQAHRDSYPLDVASGFWNQVKTLAESGTIVSIDKVRDELYDKNDALEGWCRANLPDYFFRDTAGDIDFYARVIAWASSKSEHYQPGALNEFLDAMEADAFIIAHALADSHNRTIVSYERSDPNRKNKIKIPDVCQDFSIQCIRPIDMFRQLKLTF